MSCRYCLFEVISRLLTAAVEPHWSLLRVVDGWGNPPMDMDLNLCMARILRSRTIQPNISTLEVLSLLLMSCVLHSVWLILTVRLLCYLTARHQGFCQTCILCITFYAPCCVCHTFLLLVVFGITSNNEHKKIQYQVHNRHIRKKVGTAGFHIGRCTMCYTGQWKPERTIQD